MWIKGLYKNRIEIKRIRLDNSCKNKSLQKECNKENLGITFEFTVPENRRLIGNKWVFKIKRDGTYRARLVALGYIPIPVIDNTDNFAPVAHDVSFRIALARMMVEKLDSLVMDVERAFLYGEKDEEIFMKSPVGMKENDQGHHQKTATNC